MKRKLSELKPGEFFGYDVTPDLHFIALNRYEHGLITALCIETFSGRQHGYSGDHEVNVFVPHYYKKKDKDT